MTAADELFRMLSGEIDDLPEDEDGGVIFHDPRMDRLDLDIFLSPRPDVIDEPDPPDDRGDPRDPECARCLRSDAQPRLSEAPP